jgi:hypothetical protein
MPRLSLRVNTHNGILCCSRFTRSRLAALAGELGVAIENGDLEGDFAGGHGIEHHVQARRRETYLWKQGRRLEPAIDNCGFAAVYYAGVLSIADEIAQALPDATLLAIPNCGHFAYLECASAVRTPLQDFSRRGDVECARHAQSAVRSGEGIQHACSTPSRCSCSAL